MLSTILAAAALVLALFCTLLCLVATRNAQNAADFVSQGNKRSTTLKQLSEIQAELTDQADAIAALHDSHKKLRSRIGMRHLREQRKDDLPDSTTDPQGYKREMRKRLQLEKFNGK